ncbi:uncharacterized [Tachysurus ichikawai]
MAKRCGCEWTPVYCYGISAIGGRPGKPLRECNTRAAAGDQSEEGRQRRDRCLGSDTPISLCSCPAVL